MKPGTASRRNFIKGVAAGLGATALAPFTAAEAATAPKKGRVRPNVLLVVSDQHRWQSLSFTETPEVQTPNMERLAREGFQFANCISQYPLCSPSRAMLFTSRWPNQTGVLDNSTRNKFKLSEDENTLGRTFGAASYDTAYIGKWHLGGGIKTVEPFGFDFSRVWTGTNDHWNSSYYDADLKRRESRLYNATHMTDQALEFIRKERSKPFFLTLNWNPPHSNYTDAPAKFNGLYLDLDSIPLRPNVALDADRPLDEFKLQFVGYHAHISAIDFELGRLLAELEARKILADTLVVYTSDHGDALGSHNHIGKRVPYAESVRIPFLARLPGRVLANEKSNLPVGIVDLMPTLCGLSGVPTPESCSGVDYSGLAIGGGGPRPDSQLIMNVKNSHQPEGNPFVTDLYRGTTTDQFTYAVKENGPWLLFDNREDPYQTRNLIADPAHAATATKLHAQLSDWLKKTGDDFTLRD